MDAGGRFSTIDSLLSPPSVSGESEDSSTSASSRGIYTSDFGPLLLRPTARSSENTYPTWQNQSQLQYPQPPTYGSSQPYIVNTSEYPPTSGVPTPSVSPAPTHQELQAYIPPSNQPFAVCTANWLSLPFSRLEYEQYPFTQCPPNYPY